MDLQLSNSANEIFIRYDFTNLVCKADCDCIIKDLEEMTLIHDSHLSSSSFFVFCFNFYNLMDRMKLQKDKHVDYKDQLE